MEISGGALKRRMLVAGLAIAAVAVPVASADAAVKMKVKGWTAAGDSLSPEAKNNEKLKNCHTSGTNQRNIRFIFKGSGIKKNAEIGLVVSRTNNSPLDFSYSWPVGPSKSHTQVYGNSYPGTPGPENIDGTWYGTIWLGDKIIARGEVDVKCGNT